MRAINSGLAERIAIGNSATVVVAEAGLREGSHVGDERLKRFTLNILGEAVNLVIGVTNEPVRLADIVPLARNLCDRVTEIAVASAIRDGAEIPCTKGCSACCSYLTPLSVPQAYRLGEEIAAMPAPERMRVLEGCMTVSRYILRLPPEASPSYRIAEYWRSGGTELRTDSGWDWDMGLACPFLRNDVCTIYETRPVVCREYFVTGRIGECAAGRAWGDRLELPVRMSKVLRRLTADLEGRTPEAVLLPQAPFLSNEDIERAHRTWPLSLMVERFIAITLEEVAQFTPSDPSH